MTHLKAHRVPVYADQLPLMQAIRKNKPSVTLDLLIERGEYTFAEWIQETSQGSMLMALLANPSYRFVAFKVFKDHFAHFTPEVLYGNQGRLFFTLLESGYDSFYHFLHKRLNSEAYESPLLLQHLFKEPLLLTLLKSEASVKLIRSIWARSYYWMYLTATVLVSFLSTEEGRKFLEIVVKQHGIPFTDLDFLLKYKNQRGDCLFSLLIQLKTSPCQDMKAGWEIIYFKPNFRYYLTTPYSVNKKQCIDPT